MGVKWNVALQLVEGHITDVYLMNNNDFSETLVDIGGVNVHDACNKYIQENDRLNVRDVISLPSVKLRCFYLFHTSLSKLDVGTPEKYTLASALRAAFTGLFPEVQIIIHLSCKI